MTIADRIQDLRRAKGISQEELADKIGVSRQAVSKWESEQSAPELEKIILLSDYFGTTTDYLLKGIEPTGESRSAMVFSIAGTILNAIGLLFSIAIWYERRTVYATAIGLALMLLGTGVFLTGQFTGARDKAKAKRLFILPNVWILPYIPLACCFNILTGLAHGYFGELAPVTSPGNSLVPFVLYWVAYCSACIAFDVLYSRKGQR